MTDRPILFSAPMVRALLEGRKSQTRRLAKFVQADGNCWHIRNAQGGAVGVEDFEVPIVAPDYAPFAFGDRLWVREAWWTAAAYDDLKPSEMGGDEPVKYAADGLEQRWGWPGQFQLGRHRSSIFMPRWASRLTLTVRDVRVQRLQDISEADAMAEGIVAAMEGYAASPDGACWGPTASAAYRSLWKSLHGPDAWEENPWVCAISFDVRHGNIDT